jgi:hypothetical protein
MKVTLARTLLVAATHSAFAQSKVIFDVTSALPTGWESGLTGKGSAKLAGKPPAHL